MEEVDGIIIHTLKQLGCEWPDDITSLRDFSTNMVVEAASRCLHHINEDINLPTSLPGSMSARFRIGTSLASACQDLGFSGEIGYQTFLYSNEHELRRVYMFLLEKLPKESSHTSDEPLGSAVLLNRKIASELKHQLSLAWTPPYIKKRNLLCCIGKGHQLLAEGSSTSYKVNTCPIQSATDLHSGVKLNSETKDYYNKYYQSVKYQPVHFKDMTASVLEHNASVLAAYVEWENEWNNAGLASRLSKEEYKRQKRNKLLQRIKKEVLESKQRTDATQATARGIDELFAGNGVSTKKPPKGSRFTHAEQLLFSKDEEKAASVALANDNGENAANSEEEKQRLREEEINGLRESLTNLNQRLEEMRVSGKGAANDLDEIANEDDVLQQRIKEQEDLYRVKKRTIDLLPDAAQNIAKLEQLVQASSQRLVNLAAQWEKHRAPLVDQCRELKALKEVKESEFEEKIKEIKAVREKMREAADEVRLKEELYKQLAAEFESMGKDTNRSVYTRRILEIVTNIKRQKEDIDKVLLDTRALQKDINSLSGKLDRTFTVTDELIFKDAKKDEFNRKAYKLLANLHEFRIQDGTRELLLQYHVSDDVIDTVRNGVNPLCIQEQLHDLVMSFEVLVKTVEETGFIMREIRDIEDQIDNFRESDDQDSYQQLVKDLKQMRHENVALTNKFKGSS